ncbi:ExeA family protein [Hydrogenophaga pseudoflava]|uniref:ExeA family protein n=1 Tax=Hydrogenophaga pseudoflava TaxID=47421 RepID=UPI0027E4571B|nr:AAA family ATPase [Hydrogenophaga pseudoflava]MDQ7746460.1 AAA family ATPase [Hydrogenophaga pseudoflava]
MYAGYFGLQQTPFSIAPDPRYLLMSERHREALALLLYGVQGGGGFVLLTGEIGAGKTTVCRCFLEQIPENCRVAYIFNPKLTVGDLLKTICHEFQLEVRHEGIGPATIKDHLDPLNEYLLRSHAAGQRNVLIIDEAQNLTPHVLEQLRLLTNLETNERKLLQIVLIGQPELRTVLAQPELEQLAQRVIARFHLGALSAAETRQYVRHRMEVAGLRGPLPFSNEALARVHAITRGVPRRINLLCDRALLGAYATDSRQIGPAMVDKAASEVFDMPASVSPPPPVRTLGGRPWHTLALGALAGAVLAAGVAALLWQQRAPLQPSQPLPATGSLPEAPAPSPAQVQPQPPAAVDVPADPLPVAAPAPLTSPPGSADLLGSEVTAWRELGALWGQPLAGGDPCTVALEQQLQCFSTQRMTLHGLRQLNRPGILLLRPGGEEPRRAIVTAMTAETATLQANGQRWLMPLTALADIWRGDYATLWRQPEGTRGRVVQNPKGAAGDWLAAQLIGLQTQGLIPAEASTFATRLKAFQKTQGLEADGVAGSMTFMQVNLAAGVDEPRLSKP